MKYNLDTQKIADTLEFDLEDVEMLLGVFLESTKDLLVSLKSAIENNDYENIIQASHSIKGSAANLTLMDISEIAKEIETSARNNLEIDYQAKFDSLEKLINNI